MSQQEAEVVPTYDAVDTRVGPVPVPMRAKRIRPVKVVASDGTVKRETDTEAILPDLYRVWGLEVVARDDMPKCKVCGAPARRSRRMWRATCGSAACQRKSRSEASRKANAARTPEQRSDAARKVNAAMTPEKRSDAARKVNAAMTPERWREARRKAWETRRSRKAAAEEKAK